MELWFQQKPVWVKTPAIKRARERDIVFPDMVYATILGGKVKRFGKNYIKFMKRYKRGMLICVGEDVGQNIIIKTVEWGN